MRTDRIDFPCSSSTVTPCHTTHDKSRTGISTSVHQIGCCQHTPPGVTVTPMPSKHAADYQRWYRNLRYAALTELVARHRLEYDLILARLKKQNPRQTGEGARP